MLKQVISDIKNKIIKSGVLKEKKSELGYVLMIIDKYYDKYKKEEIVWHEVITKKFSGDEGEHITFRGEMPEDNESIIVTDGYSTWIDKNIITSNGCELENGEWEDIEAWMKIPER